MKIARGTVRKKARGIIADSWQSQANLSFFLILLVLIAFLLPSLGFAKDDLRLYSDAGFSVLLISGVAIAWGRRWMFLLTAAVASAALAVRWIAFYNPAQRLQLASAWWTLASLAVICLVLLTEIFRPGKVTNVRIQGAIAVYLVFGVAWAHAYHIANMVHPGSFSVPAGELSNVGDWLYYSYVTLTTVGYGDITPVGRTTRMLAVGEALTGQLYLAVLIARLVAMEIVFWQQKATRNSND